MAKWIIDGEVWNDEQDSKVEHNTESVIYSDSGTQEVVEMTETGEALKHLNADRIDDKSRMSGIDMRARLHAVEIPPLLAVDSLVAFRFLPRSSLAISRQRKRLSASLDGKGRTEIVELVGGKREQDAKKAGGIGGMISQMRNRPQNE